MSVNYCECGNMDTSQCIECHKWFCKEHGEEHKDEMGHEVPVPQKPLPGGHPVESTAPNTIRGKKFKE